MKIAHLSTVLFTVSCIEASPISGAKGGVIDLAERPTAEMENKYADDTGGALGGAWGSNSCDIAGVICIQFEGMNETACQELEGNFQEEQCLPQTNGLCEIPGGFDFIEEDMILFFYEDLESITGQEEEDFCLALGGKYTSQAISTLKHKTEKQLNVWDYIDTL